MDLEGCVHQALSLLADDVRARFAQDPVVVLRDDLSLIVEPAEHLATTRDDGGACDGVSFLQDGVILYAPTPWSRRENFTLAHELGHWLAEEAPDVYDWVADQEEAGRLLETLCDRIAQRLLLPETEADRVIGSGPMRAQHVIDLYNATQASRPVCAIALAKRLPGLGAIAILDRDTGTVTHASVKPDPEEGWPVVFPWRGQQLSDSHPLLGMAPGASTARRLTWRTPWGAQADFYVDAVADERRIVAVFCASDLWDVERFHVPTDRDFDARPLLTGSCCGTVFERRGYPCPECGQPFCPRCGDCPCARDARCAVLCTSCFLAFLPHLVSDGLCVDCRS
ncbi:ImmA/IrrE family metallo-endopeptidase [Georgenia satyanarayanai]|uniref:ImmA/IrrE family metallo-endopeptidase n=1 Tax=Georgenia satyanarayanai TaxID=860221 RepID=UPI00203C25E4|nr:ImmA/IrrE family metallo-endopeptidase [Georgenia satyanarayanai]MCM3662504.1 ImmA/IrrE family metallo-endopeptidase [Georgenia satyanarayanai]